MASAPTTREHLLEVGLRQLRLTGYTATGVKEVLDLAKVPKGSFYHYFPSKEAFVSEVFARYAESEALRMAHTFGDESIPALKRLRRYFDEMFLAYGPKAEIRGCLVGNMSLEIADHSTKLQTQLEATYAAWQGGIADLLRQAIKRGELRKSVKPDALAEFILNGYEGALVRMKADQSDRPIKNFLYFVFEVLLKN
ncbi:TetR/AcrR family transcriptional regulator [Terriglobus saanensis]|uniref:Regulatory protein TetR n=1 Tax=Terriglobus saanensis (strain ATCC BAA-1853 / DSM 23119 / SP1PR4) TaxID=401053 RepID=E8UXD7_TERSS|nr:TetR/AcrR family transcriptional regulator [Terriglobus saanensis]ADV84161.1 regulatory protein TetR [Terriglobus saanensis SP1PR4]